MADQVVITNEDAVKTISRYAEQKGVSKAEAGALLVSTARGRINAVRKYAEANRKPKAAKAPKAKAAKAPKAPKAPVKRTRKPKAGAAAPTPQESSTPTATMV